MTNQQLLIWGASGHALVATDIVRRAGGYDVTGYIDDMDPSAAGKTFCGKPVWNSSRLASARAEGIGCMFIAVGDCEARGRLAGLAVRQGFVLVTLVHPHAVIAEEALVGPGSMVAAGAVICPGTRIGENAVINTSATIDHECLLGDGVHVSPGAHLGGRVSVGEATWIGLGANVKEKVRIGAHCIIGAGALVLKDIPDNVTAYGVPAHVAASRTPAASKDPHA